MTTAAYVSVHGGHSGQFCKHAENSLEEIVLRYIELGFAWVAITEHCPPPTLELMYPDEREAGMTPASRLSQFADYMAECRRLQEKYRASIEIFAAMEIETYSGYESYVPSLVQKFHPDFFVGSVHYVDDMGFDYSREQYLETAKKSGGLDALYCRYFDIQNEMLKKLQPAVVGHFDLIRIFDEDYQNRLTIPEIWRRIIRNLETISSLDLIMDFNLRALGKGASEPYISKPILEQAMHMGISVIPGDDSHGVSTAGAHIKKGIKILQATGFSTAWRKPTLLQ